MKAEVVCWSQIWRTSVQVFSSDDGSFITKFGTVGEGQGEISYPIDITYDRVCDHVIVCDLDTDRLSTFAACDWSFVSDCGATSERRVELSVPHGIAIDHQRRIIAIADTANDQVQVVSLPEYSLVRVIRTLDGKSRLGGPKGVCFDVLRGRLIILDTDHHRVLVLSSTDGSFLFTFGSKGKTPGKFKYPHGVCVDNHGRIIVADYTTPLRLQAFTAEGEYLSTFECPDHPSGVAFDQHRGLIAFTAGHRVHVIGANRWLPGTYQWSATRRQHAPAPIKRAIKALTMIRSLAPESALWVLPNELLFEIFSYL